MLLYEAKAEIDERLAHYYKGDMTDLFELKPYIEALEIASESIEAQMRLAETLNDFTERELAEDSYSAKCTYDMLSSIRFDAKFDEDGMFISEV